MRQCLLRMLALLMIFSCFHANAAETPRLISLAPSLTEMVFAIGAGDELVGVTDHCRYPPEALSIAKIGGYQTPNFEAIVSLKPDIVLTLVEHSPSFPLLKALGIRYETFDHRSMDGVLESFTRLGELCHQSEKANALRTEVEQTLTPPANTDWEKAPRLLFVIGREYGKGSIANATIVGRDNLYDAIIRAAGCRNVYQGNQSYPSISGEGVALMNPDIIVEGIYEEMGTSLDEAILRVDWQALPNLRATRDNMIFYIRSDYVFIPGYRMIFLYQDLMELIATSDLRWEIR